MINLSEWIRVDPDGSILVHSDRVSWVKADRSAVRYIGKETMVTDEFHHRFAVCIEEGYVEDELNRGLLRLWELRCDWDNRIWVYAQKDADGWTIHYEQRYKGRDLWAFHGPEPLSWGQRFEVELDRVGDQHRLRVLSEDGKTIYVDTGEIEGVSQSFDWLWIASTIKSRRNNGNWSTGYIEGLIMTPKHRARVADMPDVETVYVPVGGGGLISGVGNALKLLNPEIRVVGVESEACASLYASFDAGKAVEIKCSDSICDGSAVPLITEEMYPLLRKVVDDSVTVSEKDVKKTMKTLMLKYKLIVEGSGVLATTAALQEPVDSRGKSVCLITGGSIDTDKIVAILTDPNL